MKHNIKITALLLIMFLVTEIIGLVVISHYTTAVIPFGMQPPTEMKPQVSAVSIFTAILLGALLFFLLMKFKSRILIKGWFSLVIFITIAIALTALLSEIFSIFNLPVQASWIALILALVLTFYKVIQRNLIIHNFTELLIYPGLAAIFVPILNIFWVIVLLLLISIYDMWAVWKSKFMIKLAKYQMEKVKIFAGFFVPYLGKKDLVQLKKLKKMKEGKGKKEKMKKIKVALAILGGGDVAFPLIFAGVVLRTTGGIAGFFDGLIVSVFATISLLLLFVFAKKGKFYPAMPFITAGCIAGYLVSLLI